MQKNYVNRRKLRFMRGLIMSLLIVLSIGAMLIGLKLLYDSQKSTEVTLSVSFGDPVARIEPFLLTNKGYVISSTGQSELPTIALATDPLSYGDRIEGEEVFTTIALLDMLGKNNIAVNSVIIYNKDYCVLILPETIRVLYNGKSNARMLTSSLQTMIAVFTIEGRMPQEIDFRFDKPVIRY